MQDTLTRTIGQPPMKLSRTCLDDLSALLDLHDECGTSISEQKTLVHMRADFRNTYGIDWKTAEKAANEYAREWRRGR